MPVLAAYPHVYIKHISMFVFRRLLQFAPCPPFEKNMIVVIHSAKTGSLNSFINNNFPCWLFWLVYPILRHPNITLVVYLMIFLLIYPQLSSIIPIMVAKITIYPVYTYIHTYPVCIYIYVYIHTCMYIYISNKSIISHIDGRIPGRIPDHPMQYPIHSPNIHKLNLQILVA